MRVQAAQRITGISLRKMMEGNVMTLTEVIKAVNEQVEKEMRLNTDREEFKHFRVTKIIIKSYNKEEHDYAKRTTDQNWTGCGFP